MNNDIIVCPNCGQIDECLTSTTGSIRLVGGDLIDDLEIQHRCPNCFEQVDIIPAPFEEIELPF